MVSIGPVRNVILLGAANFFSVFRSLCETNGVECIVVTSPDQRRAMPQLQADIVTEDLSSAECVDKINRMLREGEMITLSFGARWIIDKKIRDTLFRGLVLNSHGARLPNDRGGGGFSWRIMRGDRIGTLVFHQMDDGVDTGPIVVSEEYIVPRHIQTPAEHERLYMQELSDFTCSFLKRVFSERCDFESTPQLNFNSTYYPRIHTPTLGWIDWSWSAPDIEKFILSLDDPHPGARTFWRAKAVVLRNCQLHVGEIGHHSFQKGLIIRNNQKWLTVALNGEHCLLVSDVRDQNNRDLMPHIKEGDRFFTLQSKLDLAKMTRVRVTPTGLKKEVYAPDGGTESA
jgi:methionyl-tRNA formyltransferase